MLLNLYCCPYREYDENEVVPAFLPFFDITEENYNNLLTGTFTTENDKLTAAKKINSQFPQVSPTCLYQQASRPIDESLFRIFNTYKCKG